MKIIKEFYVLYQIFVICMIFDRKMYTQKKEIIICKFNLIEKCKFGSKCKFLHIHKDEIEKALEQLSMLRKENMSLKTELNIKTQEVRKLKLGQTAKSEAQVDGVHALQEEQKQVK